MTQGYYESVENIFLDIDSDYKYLNELQNLYDKWVIIPDENGKFNPTKLLNRDEFVGIVMEVSCKDCIKPDTALEYIQQYTGKNIFYDIKVAVCYFPISCIFWMHWVTAFINQIWISCANGFLNYGKIIL